MAIWMAVALAAAALSPQEGRLSRSLPAEDDDTPVDVIVAARAGVWTGHSFKFQATRTDSTQATSTTQALGSASVLGGVQLYDRVVLLGTYEADIAPKISAQVGGAYLGWRERPQSRYGKGVPDEVLIYAGVLFGSFEVDKTDFGDFDRGVGFGGGVAFGWAISSRATIQLYGEYRLLKFDYQRDVVAGDTSIGGNTGWFGVGIDFRF